MRARDLPTLLTIAILALAFIASAAGLFFPGIYRDSAWAVPQSRGQDLVTLLSLPILLATMLRARRGSEKDRIVWFGLLSYVLYTYIGATFAYALNELFLVYLALFSLSVFNLIALAPTFDLSAIQKLFPAESRPTKVFLGVLAFMLTLLWMSQIIPFLAQGKVPVGIEQTGGAIRYVYALDLGLIVPLSVLAIVGLNRRHPWGSILAGVILTKGVTMGLALLAMSGFVFAAGQPVDLFLTLMWLALVVGAIGVFAAFFRGRSPSNLSIDFAKEIRP